MFFLMHSAFLHLVLSNLIPPLRTKDASRLNFKAVLPGLFKGVLCKKKKKKSISDNVQVLFWVSATVKLAVCVFYFNTDWTLIAGEDLTVSLCYFHQNPFTPACPADIKYCCIHMHINVKPLLEQFKKNKKEINYDVNFEVLLLSLRQSGTSTSLFHFNCIPWSSAKYRIKWKEKQHSIVFIYSVQFNCWTKRREKKITVKFSRFFMVNLSYVFCLGCPFCWNKSKTEE